MTKKFWNNWQKRIGETKKIIGWYEESSGKRRLGGSLIGYWPFKIISAKFNGDTVDLALEVELDVVDENGWQIRLENKYFTLNRTEIARIEFLKD